MKLLLLLLLPVLALALPDRRLRPEEQWRPAQGRDISKYRARQAMAEEKNKENINTNNKNNIPSQSSRKDAMASSLPSSCGIEGPPSNPFSPFIVGGVEAAEHQWPWMAALFIDDAWFCGGTLISANYVLTAAHCVDGASYIDIMLGAHNVQASDEPHRVEITSYNSWTHPQWNSNDLSNDLALIELPSPVDFNDYISAVCLPDPGSTCPETGDTVCAAGWGKPSDSAGGISPVLREVCDLTVISNSDCNDIYGIISPGTFCVNTTGGHGTCNGDSGGPVTMPCSACSAEGLRAPGDCWTQVGIVSFGSSAGCEVGMPAGFTRVGYYIDWILSETGGRTI